LPVPENLTVNKPAWELNEQATWEKSGLFAKLYESLIHGEPCPGGSIVVTVREPIGAVPEFRKHCCEGAPGSVGSLLPSTSTEKVNGSSVIGIEPQPPAAPVIGIILGSFGDVPSALTGVDTRKIVAKNAARKITLFILSSKVDRG
jgi:hypothetical protein